MKNNLLKNKDFWIAFIYFCIAVSAIVLFVYRLCEWTWPEWFYTPLHFNPYTTVNMVSRWANFAFLTFISQLLFCCWAIVRFVAILFNLKHLTKFTNNSYIVLFVCLNQFIVLVLYTLTQIAPGQNFGYYGSDPYAIKSFVLNLLNHYFFTSVAVVYFFIHKHNRIEFKRCLLFFPFYVLYGIIVKITGMYCYSFEWYPYPIFSVQSMWYNIFGTLQNFNKTYSILLILLTVSIIVGIYVLLIFLSTKYVNKKSVNSNKS